MLVKKIFLHCPYKTEGVPNAKAHFVFHFPNYITDWEGNVVSNAKWDSVQSDTNCIICFHELYILIKDFIQKAPNYIKIQAIPEQETSKSYSCFWGDYLLKYGKSSLNTLW